MTLPKHKTALDRLKSIMALINHLVGYRLMNLRKVAWCAVWCAAAIASTAAHGIPAKSPNPGIDADFGQVEGSDVSTNPETAAKPSLTSEVDTPTAELILNAVSLIGSRYRYGGTTPDGFDCSGFIRHLFINTFQLDLPRTAHSISQRGTKIVRDDLQPGDLVFYNTLRRSFSHVGLYIGDGRFIHAPSKGKAVEIVNMADRYWVKRFNGARRLVRVAERNAANIETPSEK